MLVTGLTDLALRNFVYTIENNGASLTNTLYLFSGEVPDSLDNTGIELIGNAESDTATLATACDAILNLTLSVVRSGNFIDLNIGNGFFQSYFEKSLAFKGKPTVQVYNTSLAVYENLGNALLYHINNWASNWTSSTAVPSVDIPPTVFPEKRILDPLGYSSLSGKVFRSRNQLTSVSPYLGRRGRNKNASGQDISYNTHRAHVMVVFDDIVEADFILFSYVYDGTPGYYASFNSISLILEDNTFVALPTTNLGPNVIHLTPFTKQRVKGVRFLTNYAAINTSSDVAANYYLNICTVGLRDLVESPLALIPKDPLTWGILTVTSDPTTRSKSVYFKPNALLSVGGSGSGSEVEINGHDQTYMEHDCVLAKNLIRLTL